MTQKIVKLGATKVFWKSFYGLILSTAVLLPLSGQDVVIYSKKSDEVAKLLQELIEKIDNKAILKTFKLSTAKPKTAESSEFTGKSFEVDDTLGEKSAEMSKATMEEFLKKAKALEREEVKAQVPILTADAIKALTEGLAKLKSTGLAPLNDALKRLNAENSQNEEVKKKLTDSEPLGNDKIIEDILKALKEINEEAVIKSKGEAILEIKKAAEEMTQKQAEENFPFPNRKDKELEAIKKYPKFKVGDKVTVLFAPNPSRPPQKASGSIRSMTKDKIKVNFSSINIDDIKDPIMRDGMRPAVTDANRKKHVDDIFKAIRKARTKYYNTNLQPNADSTISENEKKGFIMAGGKWQPVAEYSNTLLDKKLKDWKTDKLSLLGEAILSDGKLIKAVESERSGYNEPPEQALKEFEEKIKGEAEQVLGLLIINDGAEAFDDEALKEYNEKQAKEAEQKKQETAAAKAAAAKKKKDIQRKKDLAAKANDVPEESGSSQLVLIVVVLLVVGGIAFVFFNPKLRDKLIPSGKKKKSMEDVLSNLAPPPGNAPLPMPGGPAAPTQATAPPGVPAGMAAPAGGETEKTKIDLDGDVSIVKRDDAENAPQAAPRKKISLNLGSSATALSEESAPQAATTQNSIDPGSIGGLTPPGGGLKPPGGGLTPPGGGLTPPGGGLKPPGGGLTPPGGVSQAPGSDDSGGESGTEDKSNLILNPNLDGSGSKLRLKK